MADPSIHKRIQVEVANTCAKLGYIPHQEYRGNGWRADILAEKEGSRISFEIQISPQSLKKTFERQKRYLQENIKACWLFQKSIKRLEKERPDLPLFKVNMKENNILISLIDGRKEVKLTEFITAFLSDEIRFCLEVSAKKEQNVKIVLYDMKCWKCKSINYIYYIDQPFISSCNFVIEEWDELWTGKRREFLPEIIRIVECYINNSKNNIHIATIKERYSKTISGSYVSFGCYKCDSIFGDWYINDAELEARNGYGHLIPLETNISLGEEVAVQYPHWCFPSNNEYCGK